MNIKLRDQESRILYFNGMYHLPVAKYPHIMDVVENEIDKLQKQGLPFGDVTSPDAILNRLHGFKKTLADELTEVNDIMLSVQHGTRYKDGVIVDATIEYTPIDFLTDMADWLGDIQVYCQSEMAKFGIPINETLSIIMSSNFSKLGPDGKPIYNSDGKVMKGPGYWKPEPQLQAMLQEKIADTAVREYPKGIVWRVEK